MIAAGPFLRTVLDQPDADGPRLVYADWLEERGDPHAELIRLQCELSYIAADDPRRESLRAREAELLALYEQEWKKPIHDLGLSARFRRGFLEVTVTGLRTFLEKADRLFVCPWVLHVHLREAAADLEDIADLAASPHLARLQKLDLSRCQIGNDGMFKLAGSPFRCRLTELRLNHIQLSSAGLRFLVEQMELSRLRVLELQGNGIGPVGAKALAMAPRLIALERLDLSYNSLQSHGGQYLSESLFLGHLKSLIVRGNRIGAHSRKLLRRRFGPRVHLGGSDSLF